MGTAMFAETLDNFQHSTQPKFYIYNYYFKYSSIWWIFNEIKAECQFELKIKTQF
jgi:hypothetical protein